MVNKNIYYTLMYISLLINVSVSLMVSGILLHMTISYILKQFVLFSSSYNLSCPLLTQHGCGVEGLGFTLLLVQPCQCWALELSHNRLMFE